MTDERTYELPGAATDETDPRVDAPMDPDGQPTTREPNPWLREGADAPDAADIENPDEQL